MNDVTHILLTVEKCDGVSLTMPAFIAISRCPCESSDQLSSLPAVICIANVLGSGINTFMETFNILTEIGA